MVFYDYNSECHNMNLPDCPHKKSNGFLLTFEEENETYYAIFYFDEQMRKYFY